MASAIKSILTKISQELDNDRITHLWEELHFHFTSHPEELECPIFDILYLYKKNPPLDIIKIIVLRFPDVLSMQSERNMSVLFLAINFDVSCKIIEFLVHECPEMAKVPCGDNGRIPLHVVKSLENAKILLTSFPDGVGIKDKQGNIPLHFVIQYSEISSQVANLLLDTGAKLQLGGKDGAAGVLLKNDELNGQSLYPLEISFNIVKGYATRGEVGSEANNSWEKFEFCLAAVAKSRGYTSGTILHVCMSILNDSTLIRVAITRHKDKIKLKDAMGRYPLAIAAMNKKVPKEIICELIEMYPNACKALDKHFRLPIHHAILAGRSFDEGIEDILKAEPRGLESKDIKTRLCPFMLAATTNNSDVDTVFRLLLANPAILMHYHIFK